jgi:hypothetical protein
MTNEAVGQEQAVETKERMSMKEFLMVYAPLAHEGKSADEIGKAFTPVRDGKSVSSQASQFRSRMRKLATAKGIDIESEDFKNRLNTLVPVLSTPRDNSRTERDFADFFAQCDKKLEG